MWAFFGVQMKNTKKYGLVSCINENKIYAELDRCIKDKNKPKKKRKRRNNNAKS